ncbi:penicillin acylase family protein [Rugamonas apoptosis]|uniref:Penicillin acylase family protein n=1 Tax=Rugamonas apoptosis TaxID=2758570 RepID=A0A7W2FCH3_9BURK|nr:penicillin acylase family protein [Rugamonas apoptosis]MBA5689188.1 penicillin acylase family protein [Rugamonas apoptosis]
MRKSRTRVWTGRIALGAAGLVAASALGGWLYLRASMAQLDGELQVPALHAQVSVARDAHGVPLISGADRLDVAYATGYVHAQDRYFQMDLLRRVAAGELSELFGARALGVDRVHRLHRFRARATLALRDMPAGQRALLDRYVGGVNAGLQALSARPFEYALIGMAPRPWSAEDTLLVIWAMYFDLQGGQEPRELARGWLMANTDEAQRAFLAPTASQWDAPLDADQLADAEAPIPAAPPAWWGRPRAQGAPQTASIAFLDMVGSNNWAVAGSRSADGGAIVSDDMHLGIQLPNTWYRAALQFPDAGGGQRRVVGVTLPGTPAVVVGSNGRVAWGFTNSYGDYLDLIALDSDGAHPGQVRTQTGWETPAPHEEIILVKGAPADKLLVRETSLGPIREVAGRQYAVHWTAHTAAAVNFNALRLESANSVEQALMIAPTLGIPAQNFVAGDDRGNIGWTIAGPLPRRAATGDAATYPLAAGDAAGVWQGWLAPADYPRVFNPAGGQLATANSRQLAGPGAALIGDGGFDLGARTHQVRDDLRALGGKTSVPQVYAVGLDDRAVFMEGWRERALKVLTADNGKAVAGHAQRAEALRLLKDSWTGHASVDSTGYRIARGYMHALYDIVFEHANDELAKLDPKSTMAGVTQRWPVPLARLVDAKPAAWLPASYANWQELQLAAIDRVIADLTKDGQPLAAATWGQRNTAASAHPFSSAVPLLGRWLKVPAEMLPGDSHMPRVAGPTFGQSERLTVTPGKEEQGIFNMPGGQSGHPLSPYFLDGREDWVAGRQTPLLPGPAAHTLTFVR